MRSISLLLVFFMMFAQLQAQSIRTHVSTDTLSAGDTFLYIITATSRPEIQVIFPDGRAFQGPFEFSSAQRYRGVISRDSVVYRLQFFGVSDTVLTSLPVQFIVNNDTLVLNTAPVPVYFQSQMDTDTGELKPFKPNFEFTRSLLVYLLIFTLLLVSLFLLWYFRDRFFKKDQNVPDNVSPVEIPPFVNPYTVLEKEVKAHNKLESFRTDNFQQLHVNLSNAIRRYFEDVYDIPALESTTREFLGDLSRSRVDDTVINLIRAVLNRCDLIKFAKVTADEHSTVLLLDNIHKLLDFIRFHDQQRLRELRIEYEIKHGLRTDDADHSDKKVASIVNDKELEGV